MPRNAEVIRQWTILREIERARNAGVTIDELAALCDVTTRTIRRDLQALEEAGFPLYDDRSHDDGRTRWTINGQAFKGLAAGLTLSELCALYFSRTLLESLAGTPFRDELETRLRQVERDADAAHAAVSGSAAARDCVETRSDAPTLPAMRRASSRSSRARSKPRCIIDRRRSPITRSRATARNPTSSIPTVSPTRKVGLYLLAYVPEYREVRTFAVERIHDMSLLEDRFTPIEELPDEAFPHSMGVHSGPPEEVEIEFQSAISDYVKSREWHPSQQLSERPDGSVVMKLHVCLDQALHSWILSFGPFARVRSPEHLATIIAKQLEDAHLRYADTGTT